MSSNMAYVHKIYIYQNRPKQIKPCLFRFIRTDMIKTKKIFLYPFTKFQTYGHWEFSDPFASDKEPMFGNIVWITSCSGSTKILDFKHFIWMMIFVSDLLSYILKHAYDFVLSHLNTVLFVNREIPNP